MSELPIYPRVKLIFKGAFLTDHYDELSSNYMYFFLTMHFANQSSHNVTELLKLPIANITELDNVKLLKRSSTIYLKEYEYQSLHSDNVSLQINMLTELEISLPVNLSYDPSPLDTDVGLLMAAAILMGLYVLIIWELVHRTFAAIVASTLAIGE